MTDNFVIKDSGERREFETGAQRDRAAGKARPDLISAYALWRLGVHMGKGAEKYEDRNWEKGMPVSEFLASVERHILQYKMGDREEDHLAAIMFGIQAIIHFEELAKRGDETALQMLDQYASAGWKEQFKRDRLLEAMANVDWGTRWGEDK